MTDLVSLAERYRCGYYGGDLASLRTLLVDDFTFVGPVVTYRGIDRFLKASDHVARMVKSVKIQAVFSHGNEVCAILMLVVDHEVRQFPIVEWYRFEGDRI